MTASTFNLIQGADFPEQRFPPPREWTESYRGTVSRGRAVMASSRVVICGLARNVGELLPLTIARIERLGNLFADYRVLLYENDSSDDTPEQLAQWAASSERVVIISETLDRPRHESVR